MFKTIFAALVLAAAFVAPASAASNTNVARVVGMIANKKIPVISREGAQIVFVHKGMRYTFWDSGERIKADDPNSAWLSVWVRKNGTSGQDAINTFSDHGFDGNVDFGIGADKAKVFQSDVDGSKPEGLENQAFWQKQYDSAINAAVEYLRSHSK